MKARLQAQASLWAQGDLASEGELWVWRGLLVRLQPPALLPAQLTPAVQLRAQLCMQGLLTLQQVLCRVCPPAHQASI